MNTALRCATSAAAGNSLGTAIKYLRGAFGKRPER
jgi:membrane protein YqaA with SNARE-associated domain